MKQFLEFMQHHWVLWASLAVALVLLIIEEIRGQIGKAVRLSPQEMTSLMNHEGAVAIDLRSQQAFLSGHILGAINIAQTDLEISWSKLEAHKNKLIILVDANEAALHSVAKKFKLHGFSKINILKNGIESWKDANLPLVKGK
jgi:rhodanese-related sulfurtransferase